MASSNEDHAIGPSFDMKDYVEATTDAARRTRTVTIVLVVASVLIGIGWYNSLSTSWQLFRMRQAFEFESHSEESLSRKSDLEKTFTARSLDFDNHPQLFDKEEDKKSPADKFREYIRQESVKAYIENVRSIKAPFFGISFDVNDLGLVGGIALIIILLLMRYSLSREIKNLNVSLREAVCHDQLPTFYHAVAMRQVFTVPHMKGEEKNRWLAQSPRTICILPAFVFLLGVTYDYYSVFGPFKVFRPQQVTFTLIIETAWLAVIIYLAFRCWERQVHIDGVWEQHWNRMEGRRSAVIRLSPDLVQEFGSDDNVDRALRTFRTEAWDPDDPF